MNCFIILAGKFVELLISLLIVSSFVSFMFELLFFFLFFFFFNLLNTFIRHYLWSLMLLQP